MPTQGTGTSWKQEAAKTDRPLKTHNELVAMQGRNTEGNKE